MKKLLIFIFPVIVFGCGSPKQKVKENLTGKDEIKYARGFSLIKKGGDYEVEAYNPWDNYQVLSKYTFSSSVPSGQNNSSNFIEVPIKRGVFLSSTYIGFLASLHSGNCIAACSGANRIYDTAIYNRYQRGEIVDLGNALNFNPESIIAQSPDVVMKYIYQTPDEADAILKSAGIPVVYNIEFMETHPLGRAEWIKLMGVLTGKKKLADSIFTVIEKNYLKYVALAKTVKYKPTVMVGNTYKGIWYAAGGKSYVAQLIKDAYADYYWSNDSVTGSLPLSLESVLQKQKDADFWINANANSLAEIENIESRCVNFKSFKNKNVYHYNKRVNPEGGLDYYESGVVRPDLLLRDLLIILHPGLLPQGEKTTYWKKLD